MKTCIIFKKSWWWAKWLLRGNSHHHKQLCLLKLPGARCLTWRDESKPPLLLVLTSTASTSPNSTHFSLWVNWFIGLVVGLTEFCWSPIPTSGIPHPNIRGSLHLWIRQWHPLHVFEVTQEASRLPWTNSRGAAAGGLESRLTQPRCNLCYGTR